MFLIEITGTIDSVLDLVLLGKNKIINKKDKRKKDIFLKLLKEKKNIL
jgi:hypothetical protein